MYCTGDDTRHKCPDNRVNWPDEVLGVGSIWTNRTGAYLPEHCQTSLHIADEFGIYYTKCPFNGTNYYCTNRTHWWYAANNGYYLSQFRSNWGGTYHSVKPCTNAPENVFYTGPGTPDSEIVDANNCPWQCMDGYGPITNNTCALLCTAGVRKLYVGNTVWAALFDEKRTSSAIHISVNNKMCYVDMVPGNMPGTINVQYNASVYHTVAQE